MKRLGIILKKLREEKGMSQQELAEKANVGKGTVGDIERGAKNSTPKTLEKISKALNLDEKGREELFSGMLPEDVGIKLSKREEIQKEEFMKQATLMFNDEKISSEDKQKIFDSLQEVFFTAKLINKNKRKK